MVLGTSEVEIAFHTYIEDPTEENLQAFIRSNPRDHNESIQKDVYLEAIRDSQLSWEKRLEKRLSEKTNQILISLCKDHFINHTSGANKSQLVKKLISHFQEIPGEWELGYSSDKKKFVITNKEISLQKERENEEMSIQNNNKKENVNTPNKINVNTDKKTRKEWIQIRVFASEKETIKQNAETNGYNSISKFARDVLTNRKDVLTNNSTITTKKQTEINGCCRQLIFLMDGIFQIQYPTQVINKLLDLLDRKTDEKLIERVRGYLDE